MQQEAIMPLENEGIILDVGDNICQPRVMYVLPYNVSDKMFVNCLILDGIYKFESMGRPIKYKNRFSNKILLSTEDGSYQHPKFVYDAKKNFWYLITIGYCCFLEQEIGYEKC